MNIIKTTTIRTALEKAATAVFNIEYYVSDGTLERVTASISIPMTPMEEDNGQTRFVGNISYENGNFYCSIADTEDISGLITQFEQYLTEIKADLTPDQGHVQSSKP